MNKKETKISKEIKINKKLARRNYSNQTGITLIALVVTIVVLLILAGVSINALFGDSGIINKAKDAQNKMDQAAENDQKGINELSNWLDSKINGNSGGNTTGGNTTGGDDKPSTSELPSTSYTIPYYPDNTFTKVEETNLSNGLVIQDGSENRNEYVWIEVPKTAEVYPTAGLKITNFTETEYTAIETDLHTYTDYYRRDKNGTLTSYKDEYYSDDVTGLTSAQYTELKQKMLKSVYENGGFWIGRYEAGITKNRNSKDEKITAAPLSKAGTVENAVYPYTYVTCSQAQTLASQLSTEKSYTSSLMFGVQWDLVLKHIEVKAVEQGTELATIQSALRTDSKDWGNSRDATFKINRGKYADYKNYTLSTTWTPYNQTTSNNFVNSNSVKQVQSSDGNGILLTTGASDTCQKMNIYDLAGNVFEWTLEYTAYTNNTCAPRGGTYEDVGSYCPASYRNISFSTTYSSHRLGFRPSLYK